MKRLLSFLFLLFLIILFLTNPSKCIAYGETGLLLWFHKMLPTLFPFMVISGIIVRLNLYSYFPSLSSYVILVGFLCGFPMGAYTAASMYQEKQISDKEAQYLISFTNNLGPAFFLSYLLPSFSVKNCLPFLLGMYGIPLLYGLLLRYTAYSSCCFNRTLHEESRNLSVAIDASVTSSITSITKLGGYMILLQTLYLLPELLLNLLRKVAPISPQICSFLQAFFCCALEITGGIPSMTAYSPFFVLILLPFGGISCILQTGSILSQSGLSLTPYLFHKLIQTMLCVIYYAFLSVSGFL